MKDTQEVLRDHVSDMITVEKHTLESIEQQVEDGRLRRYTEAYDLVRDIERIMQRHINALEQYLSSLEGGGGAESVLKKAAATAIGAVAGVYSRVRGEDPVSRNLRDNYASLSLASISYTMLHTTALALGETRLSELALQHLRDLTPVIVSLSRCIPTVVAQELSEEGKVLFPTAGQEAIRSTQQAWSHTVTGAMS